MRNCRKCSVELTNDNWCPADKRQSQYRCRSCKNNYIKNYYKTNDEFKKKNLEAANRRYATKHPNKRNYITKAIREQIIGEPTPVITRKIYEPDF